MTTQEIYKKLQEYTTSDRLQMIRAEYKGTDEGFIQSVNQILKELDREHKFKVYDYANNLSMNDRHELAEEHIKQNMPNLFIDTLRNELNSFIPIEVVEEPKYKTQNNFKLALLFATGKMNDYFKIVNGKLIKSTELSFLKIAKIFNEEVDHNYIKATLNGYNDKNKNIFLDNDILTKAIEHLENKGIPIDPKFIELYSSKEY